jgi:hypothetical protein
MIKHLQLMIKITLIVSMISACSTQNYDDSDYYKFVALTA